MTAPQELDWRTLPLDGTTLIEASAGTGKTWNIALLHLRLLIEGGLTVRQILVTTFTDAAADELKARIRLRLLDAERLGVALTQGLPIADAERELADFIAARMQIEPSDALLARLRLALTDVDLAPISTIHSFCRRVLTDFPFDTGVAFTLGEVVDEPALVRECVEDWWRHSFLGDEVDPWHTALVLPQGLDALASRVNAPDRGAASALAAAGNRAAAPVVGALRDGGPWRAERGGGRWQRVQGRRTRRPCARACANCCRLPRAAYPTVCRGRGWPSCWKTPRSRGRGSRARPRPSSSAPNSRP